MKKLHYVLGLLLICAVSRAGTITHTDYTAGNVITAAGQNTNENTIVNEFNGNIESANIKDGTIVTGDISASAGITHTQMSTSVQSTFTYVNTLGTYRRPVLRFINVTTVDIENNTSTLNQTCVQFPNEQRCVTEDTSVTSVNRRFVITETASNSGTKNSGLRTGYIETANTWYALYAWKVSDNSTDFVIVGDTLAANQANYSALNTFYGLNQWIYVGRIRNGDNVSATADILSFRHSGNTTVFINAVSGNGMDSAGLRLATTAGATSLSYNTSNGTGTTDVPAEFKNVYFAAGHTAGGTGTCTIRDNGNSFTYYQAIGTSLCGARFLAGADSGVRIANASSIGMDIYIVGFIDNALGVGFNPQM